MSRYYESGYSGTFIEVSSGKVASINEIDKPPISREKLEESCFAKCTLHAIMRNIWNNSRYEFRSICEEIKDDSLCMKIAEVVLKENAQKNSTVTSAGRDFDYYDDDMYPSRCTAWDDDPYPCR